MAAHKLITQITIDPPQANPKHVEFGPWDQDPLVRTFPFSGATLTVTWQPPTVTTVGGKSMDTYECKLSVTKAGSFSTPGFSLFTIGIQGRKHGVRVSLADPGDSTYIELTPGISKPITQNGVWFRIPGSGYTRGTHRRRPVDPDGVGFIWFDGTWCTLNILSERVQHADRAPHKKQKKTRRDGIKMQHDSEPPPPESGGGDGDQQEP